MSDTSTQASIEPAHAPGCGSHDETGRKALAVDPDTKARNLKRLRRIEGQIRGLQKMVEDDRYCADILTQISSAHEAFDAMYDELVDMMYKHSR
jgi:DNA-binding FrmR family transcriptional regulator